ncbi:serine/threonine protein kinase [Yasminevirus sp. GU-2018]|uniref:Serine/threonine protein kinase n=1 Tax=Yasminevirus sp. GU-2018 TaxID=2420051 RepID=A0A5K0UAQ9_9VIRU|nr:serine/threonine protein kinase [Yasminevirus sp. GU-2018]
MNDSLMSNLVIDDKVIKTLLSDYKDHSINGVKYNYLGKGGEGVVYKVADRVVKIYTKVEMNMIVKEFYVFGLLKELSDVNKNVVQIFDYYLAYSNPVLTMELMDGDLTKWCTGMVENTTSKISDERYDELWLGMIFQVTYGLMFLNRLKILHTDTKSKNILFKAVSNDDDVKIYDEYKINDQSYSVPTNYRFKIADFGAVQILGSSSNRMTDEQIGLNIQKREDLYELSRILFRIKVNFGMNDYGWSEINVLLKSNKEYRDYQKQQREKLDVDLGHMPQKIRDKMLLRSLIYYAIENDLIDSEEIVRKHNLRMPSERVNAVLDRLIDPDVRNVFDLFTMFKTR